MSKNNCRNLEHSIYEPQLIKLVPKLCFVYNFICLILFNCNAHVLYTLIFSSKLGFILEASHFLILAYLDLTDLKM